MILLFIHGFATGPEVWREQIGEFSGDHRVITNADQIGRLNDVFVVGWSMGGWKAMELCLECPKKVKGLILVSAFAKYLKSKDYPYGTSPALLRKLEKKIKADYKSGLRYFYDLMFKENEHEEPRRSVAGSELMFLPIPEKEDVDRWFDKLRNEDKREILRKIQVPVLLIHGDQDQISPAGNSKFMHERLPNSELHVFEKVGHAPFLEAAGKFNSCLRGFIQRHAG